MGAGSSKVDWDKQPIIPEPLSPIPQPVTRSQHKHGIDDGYYPSPTPFVAPAAPQISRSHSARSPNGAASAGVKERREKRSHRAYTSESIPTPGHWDPNYYSDSAQARPHIPLKPSQPPLRNPLPPPPKDLFAEAADFSRVHYASPPPFIPVPNDELKRSRTGKGKARETLTVTAGREVLLQRGEPSSSFSSHSSASTSNPPPQVITTSPFGVQYHSQALHDPMASSHDRNTPSRSKTLRFFSNLKSSFSRSPERPEQPSIIIPSRPSMQQSHHSPTSPSDGRPISPPYMLSRRGAQAPAPTIPPTFFYWPEAPGYGFTTFSPHKILYKKRLYPTAEHLYQSMKFLPSKGKGGDLELAERIRTCSQHPRDAVLEGRLLNKKARPDWKEMRTVWMDEIMYMKFSQHPDLRHELVNTAPADLVFASPADAYWGVGPENAGRNELGHSLVRVRARILREMGK